MWSIRPSEFSGPKLTKFATETALRRHRLETVRVGCPTERVFRPEINQIHNRNSTSKTPTGDREWGVSDRANFPARD